MTEDWNTTDELKKDIITAVYKDINDQIEEMVEDIGCPRSFAEGLLKSIADNFKDGTTLGKTESSYSSRHASTPEHERGAQEIVIKHEREARKGSSCLLKDINKKIEDIENNDTQVLYIPLDISQLKTKRKELKQSLLRTKKRLGKRGKRCH